MPLVAAAVCPHPPLLVPEVAGAAAGELDDLRAAGDAALTRLFAAAPEVVLLVGGGPRSEVFRPADHGSLRGYGLDRPVPLWRQNCAGGERLPLSLTIGAWLVGRSGTDLPRLARAVAADASPVECAELGSTIVAEAERRTALLVLGDGSACRGVKAPGYDDPRAPAYDEGVAAALAGADAAALLGLDPVLSAELKVAGRAPWQVLAGAVRAAGGDWRGDLSYHQAPYGVAYFVANWERV
ncbi:class III extradiol dioxygenase subunit B-like domain-containing protein [Micromonospora soli]|uniref:class III extradiol dioxygenase subunit B-like domain-containing protein n=1 Tax=Micromonospora sp. NBRC 110009 TaxID=3061627 RepID=UPI0026716C34|nr:class III extradiol dioxygenase subunit B-like domain-containing protein [Micromonospora sp. NBRC 110009]WKT99465.1 class III extradiol dioxygenase subunit B-like domain-containing protein [Micromonospora sp. NBRC 110009]